MKGDAVGSVLVHIDPVDGPVGAWSVDGEQLRGHYLPGADAARERALLILANRGDSVPWEDWFIQLAERSAYFDDFILVAVADPDLAAVLNRYTTNR